MSEHVIAAVIANILILRAELKALTHCINRTLDDKALQQRREVVTNTIDNLKDGLLQAYPEVDRELVHRL